MICFSGQACQRIVLGARHCCLLGDEGGRLVAQDADGDGVGVDAVLAQDVHRAHERLPAGLVVMEQVPAQQH